MRLREQHAAEIETILAKYAQRRSAVLPLLYMAQDTYGYLSDAAVREVATVLELPPTDVFEVVGFYSLFYNKPVPRWVLQVCDDVPCCFCGAEELITALKQTLGVAENQPTGDGLFVLERVKCLASCDKAPVVQANLDYYYQVTPEKIAALLDNLRASAAAGGLSVSGRFAEDYALANGQAQRIARPDPQLPAADLPPAVEAPPAEAEAPPAEAEPEKAAQAEEESVEGAAEEAAKDSAEDKAAAESPVAPSPDRSPAGERPAPNVGDQGAVPAYAQQQAQPGEKPADEAPRD